MNDLNDKGPYKSLRADEEVFNSIREQMEADNEFAGVEGAADRFTEVMDIGPTEGLPMDELEAIVLLTGRPALFIQNGDYLDPPNEVLRDRLNQHRDTIKKVIPAVGRIDVISLSKRVHMGTAWRLSEDILVTNRHVAKVFAREGNGEYIFKRQMNGLPLEADVDFVREYQQTQENLFNIAEVLHIEPDTSAFPDMALLRVAAIEGGDAVLPEPIKIAQIAPELDENIIVIGYPGDAPRDNDPDALARYFDGVYGVKRLSPGRISNIESGEIVFNHDCTTLGGNSGSAVIRPESGEVLGLHFAGTSDVNNWAASSTVMRQRLEAVRNKIFTVPDFISGQPSDGEASVLEARLSAEDLLDRAGYDAEFLGKSVPMPSPHGDLAEQVTHVGDDENGELRYLHYSVVMHKERRLALFTACNIDGDKAYRITRGRDSWKRDPRIPKEAQADNVLYKRNKLDRGHLVRRLDPAWGENREEADAAAEDTFFYTNAAPQHSLLNQRIWLDLEDYVLANTINHDIRVSVFTGPVFSDTDREYRGFQLPEAFWKVLVFKNGDCGKLSATGYLLSQNDFLSDLEFAFGEFQTYQLPIADIQNMTSLDFGSLVSLDPLGSTSTEESGMTRGHLVNATSDLIL